MKVCDYEDATILVSGTSYRGIESSSEPRSHAPKPDTPRNVAPIEKEPTSNWNRTSYAAKSQKKQK